MTTPAAESRCSAPEKAAPDEPGAAAAMHPKEFAMSIRYRQPVA
jgi:hypothetical protein